MTNRETAAIIVAAGRGERMGGVDKIFAPVCGRAVLVRSVAAFQQCQLIDRVVVVVSKSNVEKVKQMTEEEGWSKVSDVCPGGEERRQSVAAGLSRLEGCGWVVVHDGARPLVTEELIKNGLEAARESGAAVAAVPVTDTIKLAGEDDFVMGTPPRRNLWAVQTPQVFRFDIIAKAHHAQGRAGEPATDDALLVEKLGYRVKLYMGSYDNIKITTPADLALAEILLKGGG
jgi:2-C-methyl-D-erythritol 4-phosphate cytidylyltransferase